MIIIVKQQIDNLFLLRCIIFCVFFSQKINTFKAETLHSGAGCIKTQLNLIMISERIETNYIEGL